ncbi:MAG: hypothetical protein LBE23_00870 [Vagococcus sp.]|jgi:hypothetical protein|nr:hypothetical protein [Vagococcus sp.]
MPYHTFEFLRKRRKDPKWRDAYLNALLKRLYGAVFVMLLLIGFVYVRNNNIDVMIYLESVIEKIKKFF